MRRLLALGFAALGACAGAGLGDPVAAQPGPSASAPDQQDAAPAAAGSEPGAPAARGPGWPAGGGRGAQALAGGASGSAAASGSVAPAPSGSAPAAPGSGSAAAEATPPCPPDMQLVAGEYCTEVEQTCLESWFDTSNKKKICKRFDRKVSCTGARVPKRTCVDTYEWPNQKGVRPEVMNIFYQAQVKCAAVGKRLCTESEWTLACEGPDMKPYPYGFYRDAGKCNGDHEWDHPSMTKVARRDPTELARLWHGVPSGTQPLCISDYGVADLPGNTDEVVASEHYESHDFKGKYDSVHSGGPWYKGVRNQCRPKIYTHDEGFYYYFLSFRCCAEPDGAPTDPRTPKQRADGWKMDRVERLARFTVEDMRAKLELKRRGECECKDRDLLCRTMCGTLLGPGAVDATPVPQVTEPAP